MATLPLQSDPKFFTTVAANVYSVTALFDPTNTLPVATSGILAACLHIAWKLQLLAACLHKRSLNNSTEEFIYENR
jgi:hypothetical protein